MNTAQLGWDIGGAHVKACMVQAGQVQDVAQWPCALWQGLGRLDEVLAGAAARWPLARLRHGVTMTGEMVDLFASRASGVAQLSAHLAAALGPGLQVYAAGAGWLPANQAAARWAAVASANWQLTAQWLAARLGDALLVDLGSTTCDLVPLRAGQVASRAPGDAARLASGELVYQGVVRTPLCALGPQVPFGGAQVNVMNEFFATSADVYRLTGELDESHDQHPAADGGAKTAAGSRQRLARMVGRDAADATPAQWQALAQVFRQRQLDLLAGQARHVLATSALPASAPLVAAGCGAFLVPALAQAQGRPCLDFAALVLPPGAPAPLQGWARVCAPAVAAALLLEPH